MTPSERAKVLAFVGYGAPSAAKVLFLGEKEYTPGGTELANSKIRAATFAARWEDKNNAGRLLADGFAELGDTTNSDHFRQSLIPGAKFAWHSGKPSRNSVSVWTWAAMVMSAWRDPSPCAQDGRWFGSWTHEYSLLGTREGDAALAELYPLPMKSVTTWPPEYAKVFGYKDADAYFQGIFPIGKSSPREHLLVRDVLAPLPHNSIVVAYGRGGKGAEFWRRYDQLLMPRVTTYKGRASRWHSLLTNTVEIGISARGQLVARVGFPFGRPNGNPVTQRHIPTLVEGLRELRSTNLELLTL